MLHSQDKDATGYGTANFLFSPHACTQTTSDLQGRFLWQVAFFPESVKHRLSSVVSTQKLFRCDISSAWHRSFSPLLAHLCIICFPYNTPNFVYCRHKIPPRMMMKPFETKPLFILNQNMQGLMWSQPMPFPLPQNRIYLQREMFQFLTIGVSFLTAARSIPHSIPPDYI